MRSRQWQPAQMRARLAGKVTATSVVATPFRAGDAIGLLVRVRIMDMPGSAADLNANLARLVDGTSDSVVTDSSGRVLVADPALLRLVQMTTEAAVKVVQASANTQSHLARGVQSLLGSPVAVLGADRESHLRRLTQLSDLAQPLPPWMSPTAEPGLRWRLCWRKSTYPRNAPQGCTRISAAWARRERLTARPCHRPVPVARTGRDAIRRPVAPRSR